MVLDSSFLLGQILVKKTFGDRKKRNQHRNWKLKQLQREKEGNLSDSQDGLVYIQLTYV